ncbi:C4-dicarboxylate transporter/malic acid transport protein [Aspergillus steynii IBT 23096]|uniref:C4-dicarboxylate transporter/malic acid transport protein n=1 Tax=Aspergillus steynii IBT 23096 TaxID=1392250 RepID=A0A2I2G415_9EURO|nr:C4-dicarboxylate transporter/malic acid transport protein [Aspergillus steynii IBT 23096]PLB47624.1 C4-dicarboxylate transporter/malic acid transport protein [Aspergillus steynii IBT 23096]
MDGPLNGDEKDTRTSLRTVTNSITWPCYTVALSFGGIAVLLKQTPNRFTGLDVIGIIVFMISIVIFVLVSLSMVFESLMALKTSTKVTHPAISAEFFRYKTPQELFLVPSCLLAFATILMNTTSYATPHVGEWLPILMNIFFWIYTGISLAISILLGWRLPSSGTSTDKHFCIVRIMPFFPPMLSGTMAGVMATSQPPSRAIPMLIGGTTMQGFGFLMFLMVLAQCFLELNSEGLPEPYFRPEMFITVGPPSFTIIAFIGMATAAVEKFPDHYISEATSVRTADVLLIVAVFTGILLWTLAFFLFCLSMISLLHALFKRSTSFGLLWWCMVFPNTGFVLATAKISSALSSVAIGWVATAMTLLQVALWLTMTSLQLRDFFRKGMEMRRKI